MVGARCSSGWELRHSRELVLSPAQCLVCFQSRRKEKWSKKLAKDMSFCGREALEFLSPPQSAGGSQIYCMHLSNMVFQGTGTFKPKSASSHYFPRWGPAASQCLSWAMEESQALWEPEGWNCHTKSLFLSTSSTLAGNIFSTPLLLFLSPKQ